MQKVILIVATLISFANCEAFGNDSCRILFNKQVVFKGIVEQEDAVAVIGAKVLRSSDRITIIYFTDNGSKGWRRTIYLEDNTGQNIKTVELGKQDGTVTINASVLSPMKQKREPISIYTMSLPTDRKLAARIRVRRVFICRIAWN
jgi:archaellum component FlaF (FlaF/FlaG flagellin family)